MIPLTLPPPGRPCNDLSATTKKAYTQAKADLICLYKRTQELLDEHNLTARAVKIRSFSLFSKMGSSYWLSPPRHFFPHLSPQHLLVAADQIAGALPYFHIQYKPLHMSLFSS